jgi:hypothetical protein
MASAYRKDIPPSGRQVTSQGAGQLLFNAADSIQKRAIRKEQAAGA